MPDQVTEGDREPRNTHQNPVVRQVIIPTVSCEDLTEKSCVKLPNAEEASVEVVACVPVVDKPKCDKVRCNHPVGRLQYFNECFNFLG